jgi:hypothetical protein
MLIQKVFDALLCIFCLSGLEVIVPSFISEGDSIIVTTADGKYVSKG